jgi:hypothetical protein
VPENRSTIIKPNPSSGRSIIMLNSKTVTLQIIEVSSGRVVKQLNFNESSREHEFALELDIKGAFSVQQLDSLGRIISKDIWVLQ